VTTAGATGNAPSPEAVAARLLLRLVEETGRAHAFADAGDGESLNTVLQARREMLDELDRAMQVLNAPSPHAGTGQSAVSPTRLELAKLASDLDRANAGLLRRVQAERSTLSTALAAIDRPDGVASAYSGGRLMSNRRLDLIR
jgi:hypothetical protein